MRILSFQVTETAVYMANVFGRLAVTCVVHAEAGAAIDVHALYISWKRSNATAMDFAVRLRADIGRWTAKSFWRWSGGSTCRTSTQSYRWLLSSRSRY